MADTIILETTQGPVEILTRPDLAPGHVARITELVKEGFYNGIVFHRVIDGFMAQTGDPTGTGMGGSGKKLKAEFNAGPRISAAPARWPAPGSRIRPTASSSSASATPRSSMASTPSGAKVTSGMENVDKIKRGEPVKDPDKIVSAKIKG